MNFVSKTRHFVFKTRNFVFKMMNSAVLIKGGKALEVGHKVTAVCFDKTGTLTIGKPTCLHVTAVASELSGAKEQRELYQILVAAEKGSEHPIPQSVLTYSEAKLSDT